MCQVPIVVVVVAALFFCFLAISAALLLFVADGAACGFFSFNAPLQVFHGELGGEPQDELQVISSVAVTVTVHELDLEFVAELVTFPFSFESNGETRIFSAWQGERISLKTIGVEDSPDASIDIGNVKGILNQEKSAFFDDLFYIFEPT